MLLLMLHCFYKGSAFVATKLALSQLILLLLRSVVLHFGVELSACFQNL